MGTVETNEHHLELVLQAERHWTVRDDFARTRAANQFHQA
jgi:hypothetical protein